MAAGAVMALPSWRRAALRFSSTTGRNGCSKSQTSRDVRPNQSARCSASLNRRRSRRAHHDQPAEARSLTKAERADPFTLQLEQRTFSDRAYPNVPTKATAITSRPAACHRDYCNLASSQNLLASRHYLRRRISEFEAGERRADLIRQYSRRCLGERPSDDGKTGWISH